MFCDFKDNKQILDQVKNGSTITRGLSIVNIMSIVAAAITSIFTLVESPGGVNKGRKSDNPKNRKCTGIFALLAFILTSIGVVIDGIIFATANSPKKLGVGFYLPLVVMLLFLGTAVFLYKHKQSEILSKPDIEKDAQAVMEDPLWGPHLAGKRQVYL
jgi:hypothetical protein